MRNIFTPKRFFVSILAILAVFVTTLNAAGSTPDPLNQVPDDAFFCLKINALEYTAGRLDQFLTGVSPMPVALSMMLRMQLAGITGDPQLSAINTNGDFAIFGKWLDNSADAPFKIAALIPVTDYNDFVTKSPTIAQPDANNISAINAPQMKLIAAKAGSYAIITTPDNQKFLLDSAKTPANSLAKKIALKADAQVQKKPIFAYVDIENNAPRLRQMIQHLKDIDLPGAKPGDTEMLKNVTNIYAQVFDDLAAEMVALVLTADISDQALTFENYMHAKPQSQLGKFFTDAEIKTPNPMLGQIEPNSAAAGFFSMNAETGKKYIQYTTSMITKTLDIDDPNEVDRLTKLANEFMASIGTHGVAWGNLDVAQRPFFGGSYIFEINDPKKFNQGLEEWMELNDSGLMSKFFNVPTTFTIKTNIDQYKTAWINSAMLEMEYDPNNPATEQLEKIYGPGFEYRWATLDKYAVMTFGANADKNVRTLIDKVKNAPTSTPPEITQAINLADPQREANFLAIYNYVRLAKFGMQFSPVPMDVNVPDFPTKSNLIFTARAKDAAGIGKIVLPKQHLKEIVQFFTSMQQQMMQNMKQKPIGQTPNDPKAPQPAPSPK